MPEKGYLVVLNDRIGGEVTCLAPSMYAASVSCARGRLVLPDTEEEYFPVGKPTGDYRLFAVWLKKPPYLPWLSRIKVDSDPAILRSRELGQFVEQFRTAVETSFDVTCLDYKVT